MPVNRLNIARCALAAVMLPAVATGCATTSTLNRAAHEGKPLVMSGARLDIAAIRREAELEQRYGVTPPSYPLADLPFSFALDLFALGYTVPVTLLRRM